MATFENWLSRLSDKNARVCRDMFKAWLEWLRVNGGDFKQYTPDQLIAYQKQATGDDRYKILDLLQAYVNQTGNRVSYKKRIYSAIRSFFNHNRAELPRDTSYTIRAPIEKVRGDLSIDEFKQILASCNKMYRAAYLSMFMGGMGVAELITWSDDGYNSLKNQLDQEARLVRVELAGRKKAKNIRPYHTYLGRDAIRALRAYLADRPRDAGEAIFYTDRGKPITEAAARWYWTKKILRLGFTGGKKGKGKGTRYGKNPHELRDLFRTRWAKSEVKAEAAEYFMGHAVDPLEYNKAYRDEEYTRSLYLKAESWLNVLSEEPDKISRLEVSQYLSKTDETIEALQLRIEELEIKRDMDRFGRTMGDSKTMADLETRLRDIEARKLRLGRA